MIELKITGENPQEFYKHCVNTLVLMLRPPQVQPVAADETAKQEYKPQEDTGRFPAPDTRLVSEPMPEPLANPSAADAPPEGDAPVAATKKRGRKPAETTTAPATVHDDPIPDFLTGEPAKESILTTYTIDDCRGAVQQVFKNFETRARAAVENYSSLKGNALTEVEGKIMREKVEYTKPLIYGFGVQKVTELKPEQFAEFMAKSAAYIEGKV